LPTTISAARPRSSSLPHGEIAETLETGAIHLALGFLSSASGTEHIELLRDRYAVVVWAGRPIVTTTKKAHDDSGSAAPRIRDCPFAFGDPPNPATDRPRRQAGPDFCALSGAAGHHCQHGSGRGDAAGDRAQVHRREALRGAFGGASPQHAHCVDPLEPPLRVGPGAPMDRNLFAASFKDKGR
jgi:hypothetical protein